MTVKPPPPQPSPSSSATFSRSHRHHSHPLNSISNLHFLSPSPPSAKIFTSSTTTTTTTTTATNPSTSITTTNTVTPPRRDSDETLLNLLRQRKTDDAWVIYTQSPHLPNPTCLSRLISQLSYQNTPSALTMLRSGYLPHVKKFLQLFDEMPESECEPDILTYNVMIKLCARTERKDLLVFVLERIIEKGIPLCMTTLQSLVASYIGFGDLETAEKVVQAMREGRRDLCRILREANLQEFPNENESEVFEKLLPNMKYPTDYEPPLLEKVFAPNTRMYTTLMKGYMKAGRIKDTVRMLEAMRNQEDSSSHPDHVSYTTVVSALVNVGSMEKARQVLTEMTRSGVQANRITYNILLKGYCQQLQLDNARETIKEMINAGIEPDAVSYNTLIDGCILIDDCAGALAFFNEMRARGIAPTKISYTTLMKAFSVSGQPKLAHDVFSEMEKDPRVKVDLVAWNMLIEAYSRAGMLDPAKELVEKMKKKGVYPDVATYGSLASCIALAKKPGEALLLWNEIKERCGLIITDEVKVSKSVSKVPILKPDEGLLDTLADICVRAAFFKKALEIVAFMEELGIAPNKTKYTRIYVEMHSRMFTSKHASRARQDRRIERKRAAEAFKFWLGLPNSYYGSEWRLEGEGVEDDEYAI
ncbi:putative tetratricopeptide-like helical domain superfamily [Helianthus annuus]|nr:putative tetratricopeptide-like helical domain superfamily [Helianthus annuus]